MSSQDAQPDAWIRYEVRLDERQAHRVRVTLDLAAPGGGPLPATVELALPVWTPGSYLVREFARHVLELSAGDGAGAPLPVRKLEKNAWAVETGGARELRVDYLLYANERSVRTSHVDADHAFLSPAATFLFVRGRQAEPHRVRVVAPAGWTAFCSLDGDAGGFLAPDYDLLVDSPIEVGPHRVLAWEQDGVPFRLVLAGAGELDEQQLRADVMKVSAEVGRVFGFLPFDRYLFLLELVDAGGGGLEHLNGNVSMASRWAFTRKKDYEGVLGLLAHEYFHAWNVKRFRPEALGPFDHERENYTRDLWVAEGVTSYFDDLCVLRAGFGEKVEAYLDARAGAFRELERLPGAARTSLAQSSFDAWIKFYRPDENSRNATVSYYTKGALVALLLDLRLRRLTGNERRLEDVLRLGWERYAARGVGYPEGAIAALASEVAGADLSDFFARFVTGTEPLEVEADLDVVGLRLRRKPAKTERRLARDPDGFPLAPTLRIETADANGLCRVAAVLEGGPADRAGLNTDDLLLALDGLRVTHETLEDRLDRLGGRPVEVAFYRGQSLRTLTVTPDTERLETWQFVAVEGADEAQQAAFRGWTGRDLPAPPKDGPEPAAGPAEAPPDR